MIKLGLTSEAILNEKFPPVIKGYDPQMVDAFFDRMLDDYRRVEANVLLSKTEYSNLLMKISELEGKVTQMEIENSRYQSRLSNIKSSDNITSENVNLISRINALEKYLWAHNVDPTTIK